MDPGYEVSLTAGPAALLAELAIRVNLPAYLALESVTDTDPHRLMALLIGVDVGRS